MDMKKKLLLSMILLALCLIQASADTYYFKIRLSNADGKPGEWSDYIKVDAVPDGVAVQKTVSHILSSMVTRRLVSSRIRLR